MPSTERAKRIVDRLVWRPLLMRQSSAPSSESVTTMRFRDLWPETRPGDWLTPASPRARRAYRILEIGELAPSGYRKLVLESHPVSAVPSDATAWTFYRESR